MDPAAICATFGLGRSCGAMAPVPGGWSHRVWRLPAESGAYAIKEVVIRPGHEDVLERIRRAFPFELRAYRDGFPMPEPVVTLDGEVLARIGGDGAPIFVRAHRWVEGGEVRGGVAADPAESRQVGGAIAWLHRLGVRPPGQVALPAYRAPSVERLTALADAALLRGADWSAELRLMAPLLTAIGEDLQGWVSVPDVTVMSHRDLNQTNWRRRADGMLLLFDWDGAGLTGACREVGAAALDWAGAGRGEPDMEAARALVEGYREAGGTVSLRGPALFAGWLRGSLRWLLACCDRVAGGAEDAAQLDDATFHVREGLERIPRAYASLARWAATLDEGLAPIGG